MNCFRKFLLGKQSMKHEVPYLSHQQSTVLRVFSYILATVLAIEIWAVWDYSDMTCHFSFYSSSERKPWQQPVIFREMNWFKKVNHSDQFFLNIWKKLQLEIWLENVFSNAKKLELLVYHFVIVDIPIIIQTIFWLELDFFNVVYLKVCFVLQIID